MSTISEQEYQERIRALERLNAGLAEQVDRQAKVMSAALNRAEVLEVLRADCLSVTERALLQAAREYQSEMAKLAEGGGSR